MSQKMLLQSCLNLWRLLLNKQLTADQNHSQLEHSFNVLKFNKEGSIYSLKDDIYKITDEARRVNRQLKDIENKVEQSLANFEIRINHIRKDIMEVKGPLLENIETIEKENESIMRELKRTQSTNREMIVDFKRAVSVSPNLDDKEYKTL